MWYGHTYVKNVWDKEGSAFWSLAQAVQHYVIEANLTEKLISTPFASLYSQILLNPLLLHGNDHWLLRRLLKSASVRFLFKDATRSKYPCYSGIDASILWMKLSSGYVALRMRIFNSLCFDERWSRVSIRPVNLSAREPMTRNPCPGIHSIRNGILTIVVLHARKTHWPSRIANISSQDLRLSLSFQDFMKSLSRSPR